MADLQETLRERGSTHGDFNDNAWIAQQLRGMFRAMPNWDNLSNIQKTALDEMALKIARIGSKGSDPYFLEPWHDIGGYAALVERDINKKQLQARHDAAVTEAVLTGAFRGVDFTSEAAHDRSVEEFNQLVRDSEKRFKE